MGAYGSYIVQTFVTLLAVCAIAYAVLYGARRLGVGRPRGPISLVGQLPLDARRSIYLVKVADQVIVVGASEAGFTKLGDISPEQAKLLDVPEEKSVFADLLRKKMKE
jgi:flagellar biogenesis protein FliO